MNILKVIGPLFLDDLRAEFSRLKARRDSRRMPELLAFQEKLGRMRFLDPALLTIEPLAQAVLDARSTHLDTTLADLYDPDVMPPDLRRAHNNLDRAVDRLYRPKAFTSDRERVEYLFTLYEKMITPLQASPQARKRTRKR
jgi:hypothetical protein